MNRNRPFSLDEIKKIVYNTPGFFTCSTDECKQTIIDTESLKEYVWGNFKDNSFINVSGTKLAYTKFGSGDYIIFLHGMRDNKNILRPLAEKLSNNYCVISIDFRGHGYSDKITGELSTSQLSDDIIAVTEKMGIDSIILFGHSLGASVAMEIACKAPKKVSKLILAGATIRESIGEYRPSNPEKMLKDPKMVDNFINMLNQKFFKHKKDDSEKDSLLYIREKSMLSWMMLDSQTAKSLLNLKRSNLENEVKKIKVPVLILIGEEDVVGKLEEAEYIKSFITETYLTTFKNAGHYMFLEYLEQAKNIIKYFIEQKYDLLKDQTETRSVESESLARNIIYTNVNDIGKDLNKVYEILHKKTELLEIINKIGCMYIHFEFIDINEWATLFIEGNKLHFSNGRIGKATVIEHITTELFTKIISGELNAPNAAMAGKFKVEGDLYKLMEFQPVLEWIIEEYRKVIQIKLV